MATNFDEPVAGPSTEAVGPQDALRLLPLAPADGLSFPLVHPYVEIVYAPILGPTAVLLARSLGRHLTSSRGPVTVRAAVLARGIGVRAKDAEPLGKKSALRRALDRLEHAHLVRWVTATDLGVYTGVPVVSDRTLEKLPLSARMAHHHLVSGTQAPTPD